MDMLDPKEIVVEIPEGISLTRSSIITGLVFTMNLPIKKWEYEKWKAERSLIQVAFPNLTADQREFMVSGISPEEWDKEMKDDEDLDVDDDIEEGHPDSEEAF